MAFGVINTQSFILLKLLSFFGFSLMQLKSCLQGASQKDSFWQFRKDEKIKWGKTVGAEVSCNVYFSLRVSSQILNTRLYFPSDLICQWLILWIPDYGSLRCFSLVQAFFCFLIPSNKKIICFNAWFNTYKCCYKSMKC